MQSLADTLFIDGVIIMYELIISAAISFTVPGSCLKTLPAGIEAGQIEASAAVSLVFELMLDRRHEEAKCFAEKVSAERSKLNFSQNANVNYRLLELYYITKDFTEVHKVGASLVEQLDTQEDYAIPRKRLINRICRDEDWVDGRHYFPECYIWLDHIDSKAADSPITK